MGQQLLGRAENLLVFGTRFEVKFSGDRILAFHRRTALSFFRLALLTASSLVPLFLLARQFFLALLICLVSHKNQLIT